MSGKSLMILGTASDVGKSVICTGLCRIFKQDGYHVSPFKAQNMALNSYITLDGKEIGRSQGIQAEAAEVEASSLMNPILLKPTGEKYSQVVFMGEPVASLDFITYREQFASYVVPKLQGVIDELKHLHDVVVMEGAGSPVELNLKDRDIVNMRAAKMADAPVLLVSDIDRGGVLASIVGTLELLDDDERERVKGLIINKFRGNLELFTPAVEWIEDYTGKPVLGVVPYLRDLNIDAEDSVVLQQKPHGYGKHGDIQIAVIHLPYVSNFTDIEALISEPNTNVYYVSTSVQFGSPDAVVIPGSKNTIADMEYLNTSGLGDNIRRHCANGGVVVGICGGYQILGNSITDEARVESERDVIRGLGLLDVQTRFCSSKITTRSVGLSTIGTTWYREGKTLRGYEIHMGRTERGNVRPFLKVVNRSGSQVEDWDGAISDNGRCFGTYFHGIFDNGQWCRAFVNWLRERKGLYLIDAPVVDRQLLREQAYDRLADHIRQHIDMEKLYAIIGLHE